MDGDDEQLSASEKARARRRDRDLSAQERAGMRTGLAKQFKQVLDSQRKRAEAVQARPSPAKADEPRDEPDESGRRRS